MKKTVVVLGMHRSGSSIVSAILERLGIQMGTDAYGKTAYNPTGHFEDRAVVELNISLLKAAGGSWQRPPSPERIVEVSEDFAGAMQALTSELKKGAGFKDPRTSLTVEAWHQHLTNPHYIVCIRSEREIAESLRKRNGMPIQEGIALTRKYVSAIEGFLRNHSEAPALDVHYDDLVRAPSLQILAIADFLKISVDQKMIDECASMVVPRTAMGRMKAAYMINRLIREPYKAPQFVLHWMRVLLKRILN